jgi:hypothetical protein
MLYRLKIKLFVWRTSAINSSAGRNSVNIVYIWKYLVYHLHRTTTSTVKIHS